MKIALFAKDYVGKEIALFLMQEFPDDIACIVVSSRDQIYDQAISANINCHVFSTEERLLAYLRRIYFDLGVLAWWPKLVSPDIIDTASVGFINTHNSYLPNNRGKHPYFWALVEEREYGVSIHWVDAGIDTGDVLAQHKIEYTWEDTAQSLYERSLLDMIELFQSLYGSLREAKALSHSQGGGGSFHYGRELDEVSEIDLDKHYKARDLLNIIRGRTTSSQKFQSAFFRVNGDIFRVKIDIKKQ